MYLHARLCHTLSNSTHKISKIQPKILPGGKEKPREDQHGACDILLCRRNMQDKNIKLYGETRKGFFPPPSCEALSFISTAAATERLPNQKSVCHRCYTDKPSASTVAEEGRRTKAGVSVLTVFFHSGGLCTRLPLCEVAVAVWAAAVALWLLLVYHFCVHDIRVQPSRPFAPATRLCSLLLSLLMHR